jgi:4-carboxymuconolactone decarboxylase
MKTTLAGTLLAAALLLAAEAVSGQAGDADPRVQLRQGVKRADLDEEGKKVYDRAVNPASAHPESIPAPVGMSMWSPRFGAHLLAMYDYLRFGTRLSVRTKELAILMAARYDNSKIQWGTHSVNARRIGVEQHVLDIIATGAPLDTLSEKDAVAIQMGREMFGDKRVGAATFARAVKVFGTKGVTDLAGVMAFYEFLFISSNVAFDLESGTSFKGLPPLQAAASAAPETSLPADLDRGSRARLPQVRREDLDAEGRRFYDTIVNPRTPFAAGLPPAASMWMHSPEMAQVVLPAFMYLRYGTDLGTRLTEVAILTTARETDCQYQWSSHEPLARKAGVGRAVLDAIKHRKALTGLDAKDAIVIRFGRELFRDRRMSAETFARAVQLLGIRNVTDLAGLMAFYEFLYYSSNATFDVQMPEGQAALLPIP